MILDLVKYINDDLRSKANERQELFLKVIKENIEKPGSSWETIVI